MRLPRVVGRRGGAVVAGQGTEGDDAALLLPSLHRPTSTARGGGGYKGVAEDVVEVVIKKKQEKRRL